MAARSIEWREAARGDLFAILDYISDDNPHAALGLKDEFERLRYQTC